MVYSNLSRSFGIILGPLCCQRRGSWRWPWTFSSRLACSSELWKGCGINPGTYASCVFPLFFPDITIMQLQDIIHLSFCHSMYICIVTWPLPAEETDWSQLSMEKAQHLDDQFLSMPQTIGFDAANFAWKKTNCRIIHALSCIHCHLNFQTSSLEKKVRIGSWHTFQSHPFPRLH